MECTGKIKDISRGLDSEKFIVTLEVTDITLSELKKASEKNKLTISMKEWREKRSLDANAYYWKLLTEFSEVLRLPKSCAHNMMLRKYGQLELIGGQAVRIPIPDTVEAENTTLEAETYHIKPTSQVKAGIDGVIYRTYVMLRGSSDYDTREMSVLIDGLVEECKALDIETLPPDKLQQMKEAWKSWEKPKVS